MDKVIDMNDIEEEVLVNSQMGDSPTAPQSSNAEVPLEADNALVQEPADEPDKEAKPETEELFTDKREQIKFDHVSKDYGTSNATLKGITFTVHDGDFLFLVGPSGAGKSTIIKILIRELLPTTGNVYFEGTNILELGHEHLPLLRRKIGVVFQDFKVLPSKTVFENVSLALEVVEAPQGEINEIVPNVLNMVGIFDKADRFPNQLSGGEIQRMSIARALAHEPDVLVADEPTGMIDPKSAEQVMKILQDINDLGTTVIMATHDKTIVDQMKKRVIRLEEGKIISDKSNSKYE